MSRPRILDLYSTRDELREAIPPSYSQYVGEHLMEAVLLGMAA